MSPTTRPIGGIIPAVRMGRKCRRVPRHWPRSVRVLRQGDQNRNRARSSPRTRSPCPHVADIVPSSSIVSMLPCRSKPASPPGQMAALPKSSTDRAVHDSPLASGWRQTILVLLLEGRSKAISGTRTGPASECGSGESESDAQILQATSTNNNVLSKPLKYRKRMFDPGFSSSASLASRDILFRRPADGRNPQNAGLRGTMSEPQTLPGALRPGRRPRHGL
jgi:hypothetical protein